MSHLSGGIYLEIRNRLTIDDLIALDSGGSLVVVGSTKHPTRANYAVAHM